MFTNKNYHNSSPVNQASICEMLYPDKILGRNGMPTKHREMQNLIGLLSSLYSADVSDVTETDGSEAKCFVRGSCHRNQRYSIKLHLNNINQTHYQWFDGKHQVSFNFPIELDVSRTMAKLITGKDYAKEYEDNKTDDGNLNIYRAMWIDKIYDGMTNKPASYYGNWIALKEAIMTGSGANEQYGTQGGVYNFMSRIVNKDKITRVPVLYRGSSLSLINKDKTDIIRNHLADKLKRMTDNLNKGIVEPQYHELYILAFMLGIRFNTHKELTLPQLKLLNFEYNLSTDGEVIMRFLTCDREAFLNIHKFFPPDFYNLI